MGSLQMGRQKVGMTMEKRSSLLIMLAAALWGGIGVFFKQLVLPSDREHDHEENHDDNSRNDQGGQA